MLTIMPTARSFVTRSLALRSLCCLIVGITGGVLAAESWAKQTLMANNPALQLLSQLPQVPQPTCQGGKSGQVTQRGRSQSEFLVLGGGGAPSYNEIAIEKNVLYFQRTLKALGLQPSLARILFANGNDGRATVRYLDSAGKERFKAPNIPNIQGAATVANFQTAMQQVSRDRQALFFYFTGHGSHNKRNENNNAMILWNEQFVDVQQFTQMLDRLPPEKPVVTVMVQCYSGSFANLIYQKGDPKRPVALHNRCGFFATVKELPSVGCTPEVNEADYEDYSSSFFAGLSGTNRVGKKVVSADYDRNGRVSFREAHAFAKIDEQASDLPVSTSEVWLQEQLSKGELEGILRRPIQTGLGS
ncbi:MAG: hypothetical protein VKJ24_19475, partial [Synechococcales bacterium]|nr:hypothetical protein [Synechococcales bacterium]